MAADLLYGGKHIGIVWDGQACCLTYEFATCCVAPKGVFSYRSSAGISLSLAEPPRVCSLVIRTANPLVVRAVVVCVMNYYLNLRDI